MLVFSSLRCAQQVVLSIVLVSIAFCVQAAPDAGSLLREHENLQRQLPLKLQEPEQEEVRPILTDPGGEAVVVKSIRFTGATGIVSEADLQQLVAYAIGKSYTFSQLNLLTQRVTNFLKSKGFLLARAYLPHQDITEGVIEIGILQGRLDGADGRGAYEVVPKKGGKVRIKPEVLSRIGAATLRAGEPLQQKSLERAVLLMNDLPGIKAKARLEPGSKPDTTRILLDVSEKSLFDIAAWADNYGGRATGLARANASVALNDPLRIGDRLSFNGTHASGVDLWRVGYSLPVGSTGLKVGVDFLNMDYEAGGDSVASGTVLTGSSQAGSINVVYPFVRSRVSNLNANLGYGHKISKNLINDVENSDVREDVLTLGLSADHYDRLGGGGQTFGSLNLGAGNINLSHNAGNASLDAKGYRAAGDFLKLNYGLARLQKLPAKFMLYAGISGQFTNTNLDSGEKFSLGGPTALRAYSGGEASGDEGWLANVELRYDLPAFALGQPRLVGFYDVGGIKLHKDTRNLPIQTATGRNDYSLSGFGVGAELGKADLYQLRLVWARKIGDNPGRSITGTNIDGRDMDNQFWLQGALWF